MKKLLILVGPSGGGKTTLAKFLESTNEFKEVVSVTTRKPRVNEIDGVSYFFWHEDDFRRALNANEMIEYAYYCGNYYGNHNATLQQQLLFNDDNQQISVLITEIEGASNLKNWIWQNGLSDEIDCIVAFCYVPPAEQRRRLIARTLKDLSVGTEQDKIRHLETFFDRAKSSEKEYDWMKNDKVDVVLVCDDDTEHANLLKIKKLFGP